MLRSEYNCPRGGSAVGQYTLENAAPADETATGEYSAVVDPDSIYYLGAKSNIQGSLDQAYLRIKSTLQGILHEDAPIPIYFHLEISTCHHPGHFAVEGPSEVAGSARLAPRGLMIHL